MKFLGFFFLFTITFISGEKVRYDGYKGIRVTPKNMEQLQAVQELFTTKAVKGCGDENPSSFQSPYTKSGKQKHFDMFVSPQVNDEVQKMLQNSGVEFDVQISDVQKLIDAETAPTSGKKNYFWNDYHTFEEIIALITEFAEVHSNITSLVNIGKSFEGRDITAVKISKKRDTPKKVIWLDANIHAREWITSATATFVINEILNNPDYATWTDNFDFYILPVLNPDGFVYSHTTDRNWRKTRSPGRVNNTHNCIGADPNRNFNFTWNEVGTDPDPCNDQYAGKAPFSEAETRALSQFFTQEFSDTVAFFGSIHSYSQLILFPYGAFSVEMTDADLAEHNRIGEKASIAIRKRYGRHYEWGTVVDAIYPAAGGSIDWIKGVRNIPLSVAFELRDLGTCGFLLPKEEIVPTSLEFLDGVQAIVEELKLKYPINSALTTSSSTILIAMFFALVQKFP